MKNNAKHPKGEGKQQPKTESQNEKNFGYITCQKDGNIDKNRDSKREKF